MYQSSFVPQRSIKGGAVRNPRKASDDLDSIPGSNRRIHNGIHVVDLRAALALPSDSPSAINATLIIGELIHRTATSGRQTRDQVRKSVTAGRTAPIQSTKPSRNIVKPGCAASVN